MFVCKECGLEYDVKPDFCDCGNDEFDEVAGISVSKENFQSDDDRLDISKRKSFKEQYPEFERIKNKFDPISTVLFLIFVIAGLFILFFVGNPEQTPDKNDENTKTEDLSQYANIPDIESFWNNSTIGIINNEKTAAQRAAATQNIPANQISENVGQSVKPQTPKNPMLAKVENTLNSPNQPEIPAKQVKPQQQVPKSPAKTQSEKKNPASNFAQTFGIGQKNNQSGNSVNKVVQQAPAIPKTTQSIATQPKTTTQKTTNQKSTIAVPKTQTQSTTKTNITTTPPKKNTTIAQTQQAPITLRPKATIDTQALQKELANYKVGLRNTIGKKIDFANVVGDGDCAVSFKVSSNGKLTNRSFSKQSSNITLNDAVYKAVMATPSYNPPPTGYKSETMTLKIRFYNGNFSISLQ